MGASAYPVKTHRKKRGYVKDLISEENNERRNDGVKKVSVNSYTISVARLHYNHIASQLWLIPTVFTF
jgi:hypothetical protein